MPESQKMVRRTKTTEISISLWNMPGAGINQVGVECGRNYGFYKINIENQTDNENIQISMRERERARSLGGAPDFKPRSEQQMNTEPNDLVVVVELWTIDNVTTLILGWIHVHARCLARPGKYFIPPYRTPLYTHNTDVYRCQPRKTTRM